MFVTGKVSEIRIVPGRSKELFILLNGEDQARSVAADALWWHGFKIGKVELLSVAWPSTRPLIVDMIFPDSGYSTVAVKAEFRGE